MPARLDRVADDFGLHGRGMFREHLGLNSECAFRVRPSAFTSERDPIAPLREGIQRERVETPLARSAVLRGSGVRQEGIRKEGIRAKCFLPWLNALRTLVVLAVRLLRKHTFHFVVVRTLVVGELQNLDHTDSADFISRDKSVMDQPVKSAVNVKVVSVRKDLGAQSERTIFKSPLSIGFAPETLKQNREQRIRCAEQFVLEQCGL